MLIFELAVILWSTGVQTSGAAFGVRAIYSNVTLIFIVIFVATLVSLLISIRFIRSAERVEKENNDETEISEAYVEDSLMKKMPMSEIVKDLKKKGFGRPQIDKFLNRWEKSRK